MSSQIGFGCCTLEIEPWDALDFCSSSEARNLCGCEKLAIISLHFNGKVEFKKSIVLPALHLNAQLSLTQKVTCNFVFLTCKFYFSGVM